MIPGLPHKQDCCGCASCVDICPKGALKLVEDRNCYYNIEIDSDKCVNCGLCEKQCHILHPELLRKSDPAKVKPVAAWSIQEDLIRHSATGAIFAQVAFNMLQEGNSFVYGAALLDDNSVRHIEVSDVQDLRRLQNSKYQQSYSAGIYAQVRKRLKEGARVLFSGVPCQIAALYCFLNYQEKLTANLFTIEVLCHGVPCNDIHRTALRVNISSKIYSYRNKEGRGWCGKFGNNNRLTYIKKNGKLFITPCYQKDSLFRSYLTFNYTRANCFHCPYANIHRVADLTIGDFWGWERTPEPKKYENYWGTSIVLQNTAKGLEMMQGRNLIQVSTTWREFMPINQNLYMPTNGYDYKGYRIMHFVKHLPYWLKNIIYQNGFSNRHLDKCYNRLMRRLFGTKRQLAKDAQDAKAGEILSQLESIRPDISE